MVFLLKGYRHDGMQSMYEGSTRHICGERSRYTRPETDAVHQRDSSCDVLR